MGRPSKLDTRQRAEIQRRLAMGGNGNSVTELAAEFRVGKATISRWFSKRTETVQTLATTLATTERAIEVLPISEQVSIRSLADQIKGIQEGAFAAAHNHAQNAHRLSEMATRKLALVDETAVMLNQDSAVEDLRQVARLTTLSNEAMKTPMGLIAKQKEQAEERVGLEKMLSESWSQ